MTEDFSSKPKNPERIGTAWKKVNCQPRILYLAKISLGNEGENQDILRKGELL